MLFRLVRPLKRSGSRNRYYVRRIPADVRVQAAGLKLAIPVGGRLTHVKVSPYAQSVRVSLRTDDPSQVKARQTVVDAYLENVWNALRETAPVSLSHRQATALAGELYRAWASGEQRERTTAVEYLHGVGWQRAEETHLHSEEWEAARQNWSKIDAGGDPAKLEKALGPVLDRLLLSKGIRRVDRPTREIVLGAFSKALQDAFESRQRNAEGDYSPDPKSERFPGWVQPRAPGTRDSSSAKISLKRLVEEWWVEAKAIGRKPSTHESHRNAVSSFIGFLGHEDAARVTREDVINFKNHRLATINPRSGEPISAKTVKDNDLAGLKTIFGWAVANGKLLSNPAEGISIKLGKPRKTRSKGFSDSEAARILTAALKLEPGQERPWTFAAKRWVPWLCAYTGARVGELAQLRKEDVRREGKHWVITITPDAGTVKTNEARDIVLHRHLIQLGFIKFVQKARPGHLFLRPAGGGDVLGPLQGVKNRLAEFVRTIVADPKVAPNHGWRHRFKTVGLQAGIEHRVLDAIQGQSSRTVAETYGDVTIKTLASAISKFPAYRVSEKNQMRSARAATSNSKGRVPRPS